MQIDLTVAVVDATARAMFEAAGMNVPSELSRESLRRMLTRVLVNGAPDEKVDADTKLKRYELLQKLSAKDDVVDLKSEETSMLKALCGQFYATVIVGRIHDLLEKGVQPLAEKAS